MIDLTKRIIDRLDLAAHSCDCPTHRGPSMAQLETAVRNTIDLLDDDGDDVPQTVRFTAESVRIGVAMALGVVSADQVPELIAAHAKQAGLVVHSGQDAHG